MSGVGRRAWSALVTAGSGLAVLGALHSVANTALLRRPVADPPATTRRVAVLVPARDEAANLGALLADLRAQRGVPRLTITVFDDGSTDATADIATAVAAVEPRLRVIHGTGVPTPGWLGKPSACHHLAATAGDADVLVFVDADVRLAPHAVAAAVDVLERSGVDLVSPWPRQLTGSALERLVQPVQQWSWLTTMPLRIAERSPRPSLAAANGQFLVIRATAYRRAGGHASVADAVLEDIGLLRAIKRAGGTGGPIDGSTVAACRMYDGATAVRDGYTKSLWAAFGSAPAAAAVQAVLLTGYVVPAVAAVLGPGRGLRVVGGLGYLAAVVGRVRTDHATGAHPWPDALAHPVSLLAVCWLTVESFGRRRRGVLRWKGRPIGQPT